MAKLQYGRNGHVSFKDFHEYYYALGFLADGAKAELRWEHNEDQGAWGSEGRIHCLVPREQFPNNFKFTAGRGQRVHARINCSEYVEALITEHGFQEKSRQQDVAAILNTVPEMYQDDFRMGYGRAIVPSLIVNPFTDWLGKNTELSDSSITKYSGAVGTISKEMYAAGIISKPLYNMNSFELDIAIALVMKNESFVDKNTRGNHMYSNALKQYRHFINSTSELQDEPQIVDKIRSDTTIPETERKAIIQSRIGQGAFRKALLDKYHGACLISGVDLPKLLVASHIKPWAVSTNLERLSVDNGRLLSATYDRLFDSGLITFDKTGKIYISSVVSSENMHRLKLVKDSKYDLKLSGNMGEYLDYHSEILFVK